MKYITISREYGTGGHSIGTQVAERLGLELYDKDIVKEISREMGLDPEYVREQGEAVSLIDTIVRRINPINYDQKDSIFTVEVSVIADLIKKGPCVVIGRCADVILKEAGVDTLNVFLHSGEKSRAKRVGELLETNDINLIRKEIKNIDEKRRSFYHRYSGKNWGDYHNYDLMLDTGTLGYEACIDIILRAAQD